MAMVPASVQAHCQIPCGIYGDEMRFQMLEEHITTIEKSMKLIGELSAGRAPDLSHRCYLLRASRTPG